MCRSQWQRGLRRRCSAVRLLRLWVRIPPGARIFVYCECCVLSGRGLRRIDHSSRGVLPTMALLCVWSRNLENEGGKARYRAVKIQPQWVVTPGKQTHKIRQYGVNIFACQYYVSNRRQMTCNKLDNNRVSESINKPLQSANTKAKQRNAKDIIKRLSKAKKTRGGVNGIGLNLV